MPQRSLSALGVPAGKIHHHRHGRRLAPGSRQCDHHKPIQFVLVANKSMSGYSLKNSN
jgi:hypothetical protein